MSAKSLALLLDADPDEDVNHSDWGAFVSYWPAGFTLQN
jgi:hypothetical protein